MSTFLNEKAGDIWWRYYGLPGRFIAPPPEDPEDYFLDELLNIPEDEEVSFNVNKGEALICRTGEIKTLPDTVLNSYHYKDFIKEVESVQKAYLHPEIKEEQWGLKMDRQKRSCTQS